MKYQFIERYKQEFPVVTMCRVLAVSESGFYAWRKRPMSQHQREDALLTAQISQVFTLGRGVYGSPRIHAELRTQGYTCSRKRIARLMRAQGISAKPKRRRVVTTDSRHDHPIAPNLLERDFTASAADRKWVSDITAVPTAQGWLYLAAILDLYSRRVVGWSMSSSCDEALAETALRMALARRCPKQGLLHHSDRGSQYTSRAYRALLAHAGIQVSMSRKGNCYDNAAMESFFGSLKSECVHRCTYLTHEEARRSLFDYVEIFYNRVRRHSTLGYLSPAAFETRSFTSTENLLFFCLHDGLISVHHASADGSREAKRLDLEARHGTL